MNMIPETAPFAREDADVLNTTLANLTPEQQIWLSGFLAGRLSTNGQLPAGSATNGGGNGAGAAPEPLPVTILYGTESGNSEALAEQAGRTLKKTGCKPKVADMADCAPKDLEKMENVLVIVSTWGEGDPPERATEFYETFMKDEDAPSLNDVSFAVFSLGDTSYEHFCQMGKDFDARLEKLGATRLHERADSDVDYEEPFEKWFSGVQQVLKERMSASAVTANAGGGGGNGAILTTPNGATAAPAPAQKAWSKTNPFQAELSERVNLNGTGSTKETYHLELSLEGSGIQYKPGDSLGVKPRNCPEVIDQLLEALPFKGDEEVNRSDESAGPLREILIEELDSTVLSKNLIQKYAELNNKNEKLQELAKSSKEVKNYCEGREIVDLFTDYPADDLEPQQLVTLLRALPPRLYSIASSLQAHPDEVHLTVGAVRYQTHGRDRKGVASTYLADRVAIGETVPVYIHANNNFRLPDDADTPIIMVGPGTGIAPFRAFIEERYETQAPGKNWLFFGDQHFTYDFLYQLELQQFLKEGMLNRLDVAFSRDGPEKIYVQHRMYENAKEIWQWLESGAYFYVCGDATRMAKDVNQALIDIVAEQGNMEASDAKKYVTQLSKDKRYQRDVY